MKTARIFKITTSAATGAILPFLNLLVTTLGIYLYDVENWGVYVSIQLWILPISRICDWGSRNYLIREFSKRPDQVGAIFLSNLISRSLLLPLSVILLFFIPINAAIICIFIIVFQFLYLTYDGATVFKERFKYRILAEISGAGVFIIGLVVNPDFSLEYILLLQLSAVITKNTVISFALSDLKLFKASYSFELKKTLSRGWPFFMIGLGGWLQSKTDLYILTITSGTDVIAAYQLFMGGILVIHATVAFLVDPMTKYIYRSKDILVRKMGAFILTSGIPIMIVGLLGMLLFFDQFIAGSFDYVSYLYGAAYLIPFLFYAPDMGRFYKAGRELTVARITFIGAALNGLFSYILIQYMGMNGAILGSALSQWILLAIFKWPSSGRFKQGLCD